MSILDKAIAAVTPPESAEDRAEARRKARALATPGDWLSIIIDHHERIEQAFAAVRSASDGPSRHERLKELAVLLNGHSAAEEAVVYPAMTEAGQKGHAALAYEEQSITKVQMALLETIEPMSQDFIDKLEHIEGAVAHHVYTEEKTWFPELKESAPAGDQTRLAMRYREEFDRYAGADLMATA
jgi:hemerythrin-like domain-containing protein